MMNDSQIADNFAENIMTNIHKIIHSCDKCALPPTERNMPSNSFFFKEVTKSEIYNILNSMKQKGPGIDGIRPKNFKKHRLIFSDAIAELINKIIVSKKFPAT